MKIIFFNICSLKSVCVLTIRSIFVTSNNNSSRHAILFLRADLDETFLMMVMNFNKKPTSLEEQVSILECLNIKIDSDVAALVLSRENYFRFCGYEKNFLERANDSNGLSAVLSFNNLIANCSENFEKSLGLPFVIELQC